MLYFKLDIRFREPNFNAILLEHLLDSDYKTGVPRDSVARCAEQNFERLRFDNGAAHQVFKS
jgi:hypothetical protein